MAYWLGASTDRGKTNRPSANSATVIRAFGRAAWPRAPSGDDGTTKPKRERIWIGKETRPELTAMCGTAYLLAVGSGQRRGNQGPFPRWPAQCPPQNATQIPRWQASAALEARLTSKPCHTEQGHARQ